MVTDKKLPFSVNIKEDFRDTCFSYVNGHPKLSYIEKALAVYLGGYEKLKGLGSNL